jgi:DNA excision repair protein ERCC-4
MKILVDSREQLVYGFDRFECTTETVGLPIGDYSLKGFTDRVAIERKTLEDLIGCLGKGRKRFEKELAKSRHYELFAVVVEATLAQIYQGQYRSQINPHSALQSIITFQVRYGVPFVWAGNREGGEYFTYSLLQKYLREIGERYKKAMVA